jgi:hypothetical protein
MAGLPVISLADTGAACSLMAKRIFDELCERTMRPRLLKTSEMVCGLGGATLEVCGTTEIAVDGAGPLKVLVVDKLAHDVIIGCDAIIEGKGQLDYVKDELLWYGKRFALRAYPAHQPHAPVSVKETSGYAIIDEVLNDFEEVFTAQKGSLGRCDMTPFTIDTGDARPIRQRPYRAPLQKRKVIEDQIRDMLDEGVIQPSQSPWASPITLAPKPGTDELRFCIDYRRVNAVTIKDAYPIPLIQEGRILGPQMHPRPSKER